MVPAEVELEEWLFDTSAGPERRMAEARFALSHVLKPGDVARSDWRLRCAQPPYEALPLPRADIPAGIILSREADAWIREERVEDVALPLYEGRMIGQFDFSQKGWVSGKGRGAVWRDIPWERKVIDPQYLMAAEIYLDSAACPNLPKLTHMRVGSATNMRSAVSTVVYGVPTGDTAAIFYDESWTLPSQLVGLINSIAFDYVMRLRLGGLHLDFHVFAQNPLPNRTCLRTMGLAAVLALGAPFAALSACWLPAVTRMADRSWRGIWGVSRHNRLAGRASQDALAMSLFEMQIEDVRWVLRGCDWPLRVNRTTDPKGFWRVDKDKAPEFRHTVLTLVAFHDLEEKIRSCGGDRDAGIETFLGQNEGEGWMLPETLRLADYGLGHDERAQKPQPVASRLGPRFYDWQLAQGAEESWRECHLHARNLLGERGYRELLDEIAIGKRADSPASTAAPSAAPSGSAAQESLFE